MMIDTNLRIHMNIDINGNKIIDNHINDNIVIMNTCILMSISILIRMKI